MALVSEAETQARIDALQALQQAASMMAWHGVIATATSAKCAVHATLPAVGGGLAGSLHIGHGGVVHQRPADTLRIRKAQRRRPDPTVWDLCQNSVKLYAVQSHSYDVQSHSYDVQSLSYDVQSHSCDVQSHSYDVQSNFMLFTECSVKLA